MSIYNVSGESVSGVYNKYNQDVPIAYDVDGEIAFKKAIPFKVMTYNVGQWYTGIDERVPAAKKSEYYNLQYGIISDNDADVLFMQEYLNSWCEDDSSAQTDFINPFFADQKVTNPSGYIGHSICVKTGAISDYTSHEFTTHKAYYPTYETAKIFVGGREINIINTHNDYVLSYQQPQITDLLTAVSNMEYFILCGDFNVDLSTEDTSDDQYLNNVKRFLDGGYNVGNCVLDWIPTYYATSSPTWGKFTDQIITSSNIAISSIYADTSKLMDGIGDKIDHLPLIAEVVIN